LTYDGEIYIGNKLQKFNRTLRTIKQVIHPAKVRKHAYITLARPVLTNGNDAWTSRK
jgi:hypothetical protein